MRAPILTTIALLCPLGAWAADDIRPFDGKPGLWETTATMQMTGMPAMPAMPQIPPEQLAKMTPQQRAQVEAMMKSRMGAAGGQTTTSKSCMTKETFSQGFATDQAKDCTHKVISSSSSELKIHMQCNQSKTPMVGDIDIQRVDSEHAKGTIVMKSENEEKPINIKMTINAKWISSDCGDVKPTSYK